MSEVEDLVDLSLFFLLFILLLFRSTAKHKKTYAVVAEAELARFSPRKVISLLP